MKFIIENWFIILVALAGLGVFFCVARGSIKEWLLWACTEAEKELGNGTGKLKIRFVYDLFISKFPLLSKFISFNTVSHLVDEVLDTMRDILTTNDNANMYVYGPAEGASTAQDAAQGGGGPDTGESAPEGVAEGVASEDTE